MINPYFLQLASLMAMSPDPKTSNGTWNQVSDPTPHAKIVGKRFKHRNAKKRGKK